MKIVFTKHALKKFKYLKELGWTIKRKDINEYLKNPHSTQSGRSGTKVTSSSIKKTHDLRIVYTNESGIITVITFYPVKKGRYDKK